MQSIILKYHKKIKKENGQIKVINLSVGIPVDSIVSFETASIYDFETRSNTENLKLLIYTKEFSEGGESVAYAVTLPSSVGSLYGFLVAGCVFDEGKHNEVWIANEYPVD